MNGSQGISLYFHIPFCRRKCDYCHFYVLPDKEESKDFLLKAFLAEWDQYSSWIKGKKIVSIYFGGGTPALFGPKRLETLINKIVSQGTVNSSTEVTLEANPDQFSKTLMHAYKEAGVNRLSIGIQAFNDTLLHSLGRLHNAKDAEKAVIDAAEVGFSRISIDLMYDLPAQTIEQWKETLERATALPITHLSLYNLTIEPYTVFFKKQRELLPILPDPETSLNMYTMAVTILTSAGLIPYEISAFARNQDYSLHNLGYWTARPFIGFGPSAFSYWAGKRFRNMAHLKKYGEAVMRGCSAVDFEEQLSDQARIRELLTIRIRLLEGVNLQDFEQEFGKIDKETEANLLKLSLEGFLTKKKDTYCLSQRGILFYDEVAAQLI